MNARNQKVSAKRWRTYVDRGNGYEETLHVNGRLFKLTKVNGLTEKNWFYLSNNRTLYVQRSWIYDTIIAKGWLINGQKEGIWPELYEQNGKPYCITPYKNGKIDGILMNFDYAGNFLKATLYTQGVDVGNVDEKHKYVVKAKENPKAFARFVMQNVLQRDR